MHSEVFMHAWKGRKENTQRAIHGYPMRTSTPVMPVPQLHVGREIERVGCKPITSNLYRAASLHKFCNTSRKLNQDFRYANLILGRQLELRAVRPRRKPIGAGRRGRPIRPLASYKHLRHDARKAREPSRMGCVGGRRCERTNEPTKGDGKSGLVSARYCLIAPTRSGVPTAQTPST